MLFMLSLVSAYFIGSTFFQLTGRVIRSDRFLPHIKGSCSNVVIQVEPQDITVDVQGGDAAHLFGVVYLTRGKEKQAERYYLRALQIRKEVLGPANHKTLLTNAGLFYLYYSQSRYKEAESLAREAYLATKAVPGDSWIIGATNRLAEICTFTNKHAESLRLLEELLAYEKENCKGNCSSTLKYMAQIYKVLGNTKKEQSARKEAKLYENKLLSSSQTPN